jgi:hypothetical protein
MESRMRQKVHVRFGERDRRDRMPKDVYGAPVPTPRVAEPSRADENITSRLKDALLLVDVRVLSRF